jgi:D-methionine transport system substrate-binding protein
MMRAGELHLLLCGVDYAVQKKRCSVKKSILALLIAVCSLSLFACHDKYDGASHAVEIKVGTIAGPETQLMQVAAKEAKSEYNLDVKIVVFSDYIQPNTALNDGDLDANMFQHKPYLDEQRIQHKYQLTIAGKTFVYPMGLYSSRYQTLNDIPADIRVAIPNDPTNEGRALLLLQKAGLIKLKAKVGLHALPKDIASNPKRFQFVELDAADLPRAFQEVGLAVINTNYAIPAGLLPSKDALFLEDKGSPYANLIVVRKADKDQLWVKELRDSFQSTAVQDEAKKLFQGEAIPAWDS